MWKRKNKKYLYSLTPCFDRTLQIKEMREKRLNKNQDLHWRNCFDEIFAPLKAPSLGVLVFRRAWGNFFCSTSNFWCGKLEVEQKKFVFNLLWSPRAWSLGAPWEPEHKMLLLGLQLRALKVGGQAKHLVFGLSWSSQAQCSRDPWEAEHKKNAFGHSSRAPKHVECKCFCLNLSWNSWAWNSKASRKVEENFLALAKLLKILKNYKKGNVNTKN
jgi:hypothetical protein